MYNNNNDIDWLNVATKVVMILAVVYFTGHLLWQMAKGWF